MIGALALVIAVALACYTILPAISHAVFEARWRRLLALVASGTPGTCADVGTGGIRFRPAAKATDAGAEPVTVVPASTVFLLLSGEPPAEIPASRLRRLDAGTRLILARECLPFRKRVLAILEPDSPADVPADPSAILAACPPTRAIYDPLRYVWAAIGVFVEFTLFISWLGSFSTPLPAVAAMIAIFGKALPWCPPGLFLTLYANHVAARRVGDKKKDRRRGAIGLLLVAAGVLLNLAVVFLGIRQSGWIRP